MPPFCSSTIRGKDPGKGVRGHTSLPGAADAIFEMTREGEFGLLQCTKMKDADDQIRLTVQPMKVEVDPSGKFKDSLVLKLSTNPWMPRRGRSFDTRPGMEGKG